VRRLVLLPLVVVCLTACGSSDNAAPPATTTTQPKIEPVAVLGAGAKTIYEGTGWGVVVAGHKAVAVHLVRGRWQPDRTGRVKVTILGPHGTTGQVTQVAAGLKAKTDLVESGLWVDGTELLEKGGGTTPTSGTIYGANDGKLKPGVHVAVAYGRTATSGTAVAWTFTVR
jgi:hypothetical protein